MELTRVHMGLTRKRMELTRVRMGLTRERMELTRVRMGLTRERMELTRVRMGLTRVETARRLAELPPPQPSPHAGRESQFLPR